MQLSYITFQHPIASGEELELKSVLWRKWGSVVLEGFEVVDLFTNIATKLTDANLERSFVEGGIGKWFLYRYTLILAETM